MSTIKIRFADEIEALGGKVERAVEDMFRSFSPVFNLAERSWKPLMDMYETPGQIIVLAEVAGVDKDDLEVEISTRAVRIRAAPKPPTGWPRSSTGGSSVFFFCRPRSTRKSCRRPTPTACWKSVWLGSRWMRSTKSR
jgi:hypothetical protein